MQLKNKNTKTIQPAEPERHILALKLARECKLTGRSPTAERVPKLRNGLAAHSRPYYDFRHSP